jgi:acyl-coenzyme A thioesterase PaaI-like protein
MPGSTRTFREGSSLDALNAMSRGTAMEPLGIVFTEMGPDWLRGTMPVNASTRQPYGLLHGGASVLLAETLGSSAACCAWARARAASAARSTPTTCAACARAW